MIHINPFEEFPIVRVLGIPGDTNTYYVRAVIRDAKTDAVIDTVTLTNQGNQRFLALWKAPVDNAYSSGRFVVITTSVYTDSGYTTLSNDYYVQGDTYLIQQRWEQTLAGGGGGGGGGGMSTDQLKNAIQDVLDANKPAPIKFPDPPDLDALKTDILKAVEEIVMNCMASMPPPEPVDLSNLEGLLRIVLTTIKARPEFKKTDLTALERQIRDLANQLHATTASYMQSTNDLFDRFKDEIFEAISSENVKMKFVEGIKDGSIHFNLSDTPEEKATKDKKTAYFKKLLNRVQ